MKISNTIKSGLNRVPPVGLAILVLLVVVGSTTAVALTMTDVGPTQVSMFGSEMQESDFALTTLDTQVKGQSDQATVTVELQNEANTTEEAAVLIQAVDANGTVIDEAEVETGAVAAGDTWSGEVQLAADGLSNDLDETVVTVNQY